MFKVQKDPCSSCIYRGDSPLEIEKLERQVADPHGGFSGHRICHHTGSGLSDPACCAVFWRRHKDDFPAGQIAQRLGVVEYVQIDVFRED